MYLKLYRLFSYLAGPLIDLWLMRRKSSGKEDPQRFSERLGHASFPRPQGHVIWVHAASIGEVMSVLPLIKKVLEQYQSINVVITTGTVTSAQIIEKRLPSRAFHQYAPIDKVITVRRFLQHWQPSLALWVESELWPNMIIETHDSGCTMAQINARISIDSYKKWQKYGSMAKRILSCFSLSLCQSEDDKTRLEKLGARNAICVGNLKFDAPALPADPKETGKLVSQIGDRPIWIAASTHPGEEEFIFKAHNILKETRPDLLTIIIPRHPSRGKEIVHEYKAKYNLSLRSSKQEITEKTDVYIADTVGELGIFYRLASIVFIGGSMIDKGGQNPLEAARLDCAILTGPYTDNFKLIYKELIEQNATIIVRDTKTLAEKVDYLLSDHEAQEQLSTRSMALMESKKGVMDSYIDNLSPYLKPLMGPEDKGI